MAAAEMTRGVLPIGATSAVAERRPKHILSGIIKCGVCRANFVVGSKDYYRCASVKERGTCGNSTTVRISRLEDLVLSTLQSELLTDEHTRIFATEFNREVERLGRDERSRNSEMTGRLKELESEIANLAANMLAGIASQTVVRMLAEREAERDALSRRVDVPERTPTVVLKHPALRSEFEARVAHLRAGLSDPDARPEIARIVAELIQEIIVFPATPVRGPEAEITAQVSNLINFTHAKGRPHGRDRPLYSAIKVVAGTCNTRCLRSPISSFSCLVERRVDIPSLTPADFPGRL